MRRIPLSRRSHVTGFQPVPTGAAEHESALERDFVTLATCADPTAKITSQPVTIRFGDGGRLRRYTPDFLVRWSDGRSDLVEVKYRTDLRAFWTQLRPGFAAARDWAREHGVRFRIATDRSIRVRGHSRIFEGQSTHFGPRSRLLGPTTLVRPARRFFTVPETKLDSLELEKLRSLNPA